MAFRFALEAVLKHRHRLEEVAQRELATAQAAVDVCLREIEAMYKRHDEVRQEISAAQKEGSPRRIEEVREMEHFLQGHKIRIDSKRTEARELLQVAEEKQEALIFAAREKKILVKLKEKKQREYREWLKRIEAKNLDDMTTVRYAWGKR